MAPTVKSYGLDLKIKDLLQFVDFHHNLMIFANDQSRKVVRDLVNEFGIDFEDYGYVMHGGKAPKGSQSKTSNVAWSENVFEPLFNDHSVFTKLERPVLFEDGVGAVLDSTSNNKHVFPILRADAGSYSYNPSAGERKQVGIVSGQQLTLVAGYQTLYN